MSDSIISLNGDILAKNGRILKSINGGGGSIISLDGNILTKDGRILKSINDDDSVD